MLESTGLRYKVDSQKQKKREDDKNRRKRVKDTRATAKGKSITRHN